MNDSMISRRMDARWFDPGLALMLLIASQVELALAKHPGGQWALGALLLAGITVPIAWRRRAPLAVACGVMASAVICSIGPTNVLDLQTPLIAFLIVPYTVAAYEARARALTGLAVCITGLELAVVIGDGGAASGLFLLATGTASWGIGRALRSRRSQARQLSSAAKRMAHERQDRERLAVADERARIARELQAVVARSVSAMIVQSEAAQRLLDRDLAKADEAMEEIERTGQQALSDMRGILGVLRTTQQAADLAPQPGVGALPRLIERARAQGRDITLQVHGEPHPLPAAVDLGVYRILEEALADNANAPDLDRPIAVLLRFDETHVVLEVSTRSPAPISWPTTAMYERTARCDGEVHLESADGATERLRVRMPAALEGAFA